MLRLMLTGNMPDIRLTLIDKASSGRSSRVWLIGSYRTADDAVAARRILGGLIGKVNGRLDTSSKEALAGMVQSRMLARRLPLNTRVVPLE